MIIKRNWQRLPSKIDKLLSKIWFRIILSIVCGGLVSETGHIRWGEITIGTSSMLFWIGAIVTFLVWEHLYARIVVIIYNVNLSGTGPYNNQ